MKVRILTNPGTRDFPDLGLPQVGDELEVSDHLGERLVANGVAVCLEPEPQQAIQAVPEAPPIAEARSQKFTPAESARRGKR